MKKMRSILSAFICATILISCMSVPVYAESEAVLVACDDFDNYEDGTDYIKTGSSNAYGVGSSKNENTAFIRNDNDGEGNYLQVTGANIPKDYAGAGFRATFKSAPVITITFDYKLNGNTTDGVHFYCGNTINAELDAKPVYYVTRNNANSTVRTNLTLESGKWIHIITIIDLNNQSFDLYADSRRIFSNGEFRQLNVTSLTGASLFMNTASPQNKNFSIRNFEVYHGKLPLYFSDYQNMVNSRPEKKLSSLKNSGNVVTSTMTSESAAFAGYGIGYVRGDFVSVSDDLSLTPVYKNGYVYAPAGFVAKALGGSYSDGVITKSEISCEFAEGVTSAACPVAPVLVGKEMYIPITDELAQFFGTVQYTDDRGLAIIGTNVSPGEEIIKPLLFELRTHSAIFSDSLKSEVLFCTRSWYIDPEKTRYTSIDATKRFMSTSIRWTYHTDLSRINTLRNLGSDVQSGLNAVPVTRAKDENGADATFYDTTHKKDYPIYVGSAVNYDGTYYVRSDGLGGWGCVNNPQFLADLQAKAENAIINQRQYLWQFDDPQLNVGYDCFCSYCTEGFVPWIKENKGFTTVEPLNNIYKAKFPDKTMSIDDFDYKAYLAEYEGITTNDQYNKFNDYWASNITGLWFEYNNDKVLKFHSELRAHMNECAARIGEKIYMSYNTYDCPIRTTNYRNSLLVNTFDGGMGETNLTGFLPGGIFNAKGLEQAFGKSYVDSPIYRYGLTTSSIWDSAVPLMYATGQNSLIPWDDYIFGSTRYFTSLEELSGNYAFVREYPHLFDNYESPETVGYILDMDVKNAVYLGNKLKGSLTDNEYLEFAETLARKGIPYRFVAQRMESLPYQNVDPEDVEGLSTLVNVNGVKLTGAEISGMNITGKNLLVENGLDGDFETPDVFAGEYVTNATNAKSGTGFVKVTPDSSGELIRINAIKNGIEAGKDYEISFYAKSADSVASKLDIKVYNPSENVYYPVITEMNGDTTDNNQWKRISATIHIAPSQNGETSEQAKGFDFSINTDASSAVLIDNIRLTKKEDIIRKKGFDGQFEDGTSFICESGTAEIITDSNSAQSGNGYASVTNSTPANAPKTVIPLRFNHLKDGVEIGKTYEMTFYAKAADTTSNTKLQAMIALSDIANNTLYPEIISNDVITPGSSWTKYTTTFRIKGYTPEDKNKIDAANTAYNNAINSGKTVAEAEAAKQAVLNPQNWKKGNIHLGFYVKSPGTVHIDNVQVKEIGDAYTYKSQDLTYLNAEKDNWSARIKNMPKNIYAVLRQNKIYDNAPTIVHAVSYETAIQKNVEVEVNNKYLPEGDSFTVKIYRPQKNPYFKTITKNSSGVTTFVIDEIRNWAVLEIFGDDTESIARFNVGDLSGIGLGSRVSYDSAKGTNSDFTITTYGEGINVYTEEDTESGQDEAGFVYKRVETDNFEISAEVGTTSGSSGLMLRYDVHSNAAAIALTYDAKNGLRFGKREMDNMAYFFKEVGNSMPRYMKLAVNNSVVTAYSSADGSEWTNLGCYDIHFVPSVAGVFASSSDGTKAECNINNFNLRGKNHTLEDDIASKNLMEIRNPNFTAGAVANYVTGYDEIWDSSLEGSKIDTVMADGKTAPDGTTAIVSEFNDSSDGDGKSVVITNRGNGDEGLWYRFMPVENGKTYEASAWARVDEGVSDTGALVVQTPMQDASPSRPYYGTIDFEVDYDGSVELSSEWKRVFVRFTISEEGLSYGLDLRFKTDGTNDVYLDNFELKEVHNLNDAINASLTNYGNKAVLDISAADGKEHKIRYSASVNKTNKNGMPYVESIKSEIITVTEDTSSIKIDLDSLGDVAKIFIWEAENMKPLTSTYKVFKSK